MPLHRPQAEIRLPRALAALFLLVGLGGAALASVLPSRTDDWVRLESESFVFLSNRGELEARQLASRLETLHQTFESIFGAAHTPPTKIYLFRNASAFAHYKPGARDGRSGQMSGYFQKQTFGNYVALDGSRTPEQTLFHEYVHGYVSDNLKRAPLWFNEGLAEFYSTFQVLDGHALIGSPKPSHLAQLQRGALLPMEQLLELDTGSDIYRGAAHRSDQEMFYAQSWLMVHYLLTDESEQREGQLAEYFVRLQRGEDRDLAFRSAFGTTYGIFLDRIEAYASEARFPVFELPLQEATDASGAVLLASDSGAPVATKLAPADVLYELGDLLSALGSGRNRAAREHFDAAIREDFRHPLAQAGIGRLLDREGHLDGALKRYATALDGAPDDPVVLFHHGHALARLASQRSKATGSRPLTEDPDLEAARVSLNKALERAPDLAPAWAVLGFTYLLEEPAREEGLRVLERAYDLDPENEDVTTNLALFTARLGYFDVANDWVEGWLRQLSTSPERLFVTRRAIGELQLRMAARWARERHFDEAEAAVHQAMTRVADDPALADVMRPQADRLLEAVTVERLTARFNHAVQLANDGRLDEALLMLRDLASEIDTQGGTISSGQLEAATRAAIHKVEAAR